MAPKCLMRWPPTPLVAAAEASEGILNEGSCACGSGSAICGQFVHAIGALKVSRPVRV